MDGEDVTARPASQWWSAAGIVTATTARLLAGEKGSCATAININTSGCAANRPYRITSIKKIYFNCVSRRIGPLLKKESQFSQLCNTLVESDGRDGVSQNEFPS